MEKKRVTASKRNQGPFLETGTHAILTHPQEKRKNLLMELDYPLPKLVIGLKIEDREIALQKLKTGKILMSFWYSSEKQDSLQDLYHLGAIVIYLLY